MLKQGAALASRPAKPEAVRRSSPFVRQLLDSEHHAIFPELLRRCRGHRFRVVRGDSTDVVHQSPGEGYHNYRQPLPGNGTYISSLRCLIQLTRVTLMTKCDVNCQPLRDVRHSSCTTPPNAIAIIGCLVLDRKISFLGRAARPRTRWFCARMHELCRLATRNKPMSSGASGKLCRWKKSSALMQLAVARVGTAS